MARKSTRPKLVLTPEEVRLLEQLRQSRTAAWREVQRAQVLWLYYTGSNIATIMKTVKMTRKSVSKWIEKALTIFVYCFLAAIIAAGASFPPSAPVLYGPALLALLAGVGAYAGARGIPVPEGKP